MFLPGQIYTAGKYITLPPVVLVVTNISSEALCDKLKLKNKRNDECLLVPSQLQVKPGCGRSDPSDKTRQPGGGEAYTYKLHITLSFSRQLYSRWAEQCCGFFWQSSAPPNR